MPPADLAWFVCCWDVRSYGDGVEWCSEEESRRQLELALRTKCSFFAVASGITGIEDLCTRVCVWAGG